jgi:hypothetical protein
MLRSNVLPQEFFRLSCTITMNLLKFGLQALACFLDVVKHSTTGQ